MPNSNTKAAAAEEDAPPPSSKKGDQTEYTFCRVSRLDNGANRYYMWGGGQIKVGDRVHVPCGAGTAEGIVLSVEKHTRETAPQSPDELPGIIDLIVTG